MAVELCGMGLVWSPNFSIGVNIFRSSLPKRRACLASQPEYGAWAWEIHHTAKKDAPSGTLLRSIEEMQRAGYAAASTRAESARARIPERTKSDSTRRRTRLRCGTRRAAAKVSRAER